MAFATRVPFDLALTFVVACGEVVCRGQRFARGSEFPWRKLAVSEDTMRALYLTNQVDCVEPAAPEGEPLPGFTFGGSTPVDQPGPDTIRVSPDAPRGERIDVETPSQKRSKRQR